MTAATWIAIAVLGPGALAVFVAFLRDWRTLIGGARDGRRDDARAERPPR